MLLKTIKLFIFIAGLIIAGTVAISAIVGLFEFCKHVLVAIWTSLELAWYGRILLTAGFFGVLLLISSLLIMIVYSITEIIYVYSYICKTTNKGK